MGVGIDLAFNPYGYTFASGHYSSSTMGKYLVEMHNYNLNWVRVWACEGLDGLSFDSNGNCTGINGTNLSNIVDFVSQANKLGIKVELVFVNSMDINSHPNLVENTANMNALINNGLVPIGKAVQGYAAQIDLVNEGDYTVGTVGWGYLRNFIGGSKTALVNNGVDRWVTMSIGYSPDFGDFTDTVGGLGFDFYEYHCYNDNGWCPEPATLGGKPVELNEFGSASTSEGWNHNTYSFNKTLMTNFVENASAAGYLNVAPWSYVDDGDFQLRGNPVLNDLANLAAQFNGPATPIPGPIANGRYTMTPSTAPGSCLDVPGSNFANGQTLQIWQANGTAAQTWDFTSFGNNQYTISTDGSYCLDSAAATSPGTAATIWTCGSGNANQLWTAHSLGGSSYYFAVQNSGLCLDVRASGSANGTVVQTYTCNGFGGLSQTWTLNKPPADVTGQVTITRGSVLPNFSGGGYYQMVGIKNTSATSIAGPIEMVITNLSSGVTVTNASGTFNGNPYRTATTSALAPGASVSVRINYSNPTNARFSYGVTVYSGPLK
jgi:hypothetical protein